MSAVSGESPSGKVATLILAAGASTRYGSAKALAPFEGGTFLSRALRVAHELSGSFVTVVIGGYADQVSEHLGSVESVLNVDYEQGMSTSIQLGVDALVKRYPLVEFIAIYPVDQPWISSAHLVRLLEESRKASKCALTAANGFSGPPAILPAALFPKVALLKGDRGLKAVLTDTEVTSVYHSMAAQDVDHPLPFTR